MSQDKNESAACLKTPETSISHNLSSPVILVCNKNKEILAKNETKAEKR